MATATLSALTRQPFGCVSQARLRNLTNTKNTQNAIPTTSVSSLKRSAPVDFDDVDSENIDPLFLNSPAKKAKNSEIVWSKPAKASCFTLTTAKPRGNAHRPVAVGCKRKAFESTSDPVKPRAEAVNALSAPAGRSPKHKRIGILSRYRGAGNATRINLPGASSSAPFSLNAALAGTVPMKSKTKPSKNGWDFMIFEDSPEDEMANLMEHSTCTLDISDDESRSSPKGDRDNKENVPPGDYFTAANGPVTRRDVMTDEVRSPLGDLVAKDFYADGCDETSLIIVPAEEEAEPLKEIPSIDYKIEEPLSPSSHIRALPQIQEGWEGILARMSAKNSDIDSTLIIQGQTINEEPAAPIQIWESESAKAEDETLVALSEEEVIS